ncbi:MAG TPA: adenylyl-sulfate kinase [Desulfovibrio sp.]|uniref:adenylyl-sulfate kinase n=1 Tax=Desulfovibrio sp. TaxID=885 RepID=UPI002D133087|nr:adenylyl-sulfate kinase [Desulfovibrio sp.]HMM39161.1 adenylyl-sulfate kinase [Desulfovibrio sp.]
MRKDDVTEMNLTEKSRHECNVVTTPPRALVQRSDREAANGHRSVALWFTGLSGSGKSTLAHALEKRLHDRGIRTYVFDGDKIRHGLCADLSFSAEGRTENVRRIAESVKLFLDAGIVCLCAFISPMRADWENVRRILGDGDFREVYVRCALEECERRDIKGYYRLARQGKIKNYTGISAPYEAPENPALALDTDKMDLETCLDRLESFLGEMSLPPR